MVNLKTKQFQAKFNLSLSINHLKNLTQLNLIDSINMFALLIFYYNFSQSNAQELTISLIIWVRFESYNNNNNNIACHVSEM